MKDESTCSFPRRGKGSRTRYPRFTFLLALSCVILTARCGSGGGGSSISQPFGAPQIALTPSTLNFGNQNVGTTSAVQIATITNNGNAPASISGITISGDFAETNTCGTSVAEGAKCSISITFTPMAGGSRTGALTATDNAPVPTQSLALTGSGITPGTQTVTLSPTSLTFATQTNGTTSAAQVVTLINSSTMQLLLTSISITGANAGDYAQTNTCSSTLAAGANCSVVLTFTPTASGSRSASLQFVDSAGDSPEFVTLAGTGTSQPTGSPQASLSPSTVDFGVHDIGATSAVQLVTLTNSGTAQLSIASIGITGTNSGDFAETNTCGPNLAAGSSCSANVTFKPTAIGSRSASLVFSDSAAGSPQSVPLTGTGTQPPPPPAPQVSLSPLTLIFGSQTVGTASPGQTVTLTNSGNAQLSVTSIAITGVDSGDFAESNTCGTSVAAGVNCAITVTFAPSASGSRSAVVQFTDNAFDSPEFVTLSGTGGSPPPPPPPGAPQVSLSPNTLSFGNQNVGTTSAVQVVTLTNSGTAQLSIASIVISGASAGDFSETNNCASSLAPASACTISVAYTPTSAASSSASLVFTDNAADSPEQVTLSGTGTVPPPPPAPLVNLSPTSLTYANQNTGTTSAGQTVTLTNTGSATLTFTNISVIGTNSTDFAQINNCDTNLAAGSSCTITVTFTPTATGTRSASLQFSDNAANSPEFVTLSGTGTTPPFSAPLVSLSPTLLAFGNETVGITSAVQVATATNTGSGSASITSITATGDFAETDTCGISLAAGTSCTISVTFTPSAVGALTGTLSVTDNASGSPQTLALTGTGIVPLSPIVTLSPTGLIFSGQIVGTTSSAQSVTLTNSGTGQLSIGSISIAGTNSGDFAQTNTCGLSLAAGANCSVLVTFAPTASGSRTASVQFTDNAANSPQSVILTGNGPIFPTPPTLPSAGYDTQANTPLPDTTGYTVTEVTAGSDLQTAINNASCNPNGTILNLQAGATFIGSFTLPNKSCATGKWVIIESDAPAANLPAMGVRTSPAFASQLPSILTNVINLPAIQVATGAQNYRLMNLQVGLSLASGADSSAGLIQIGDGTPGGPQNSLATEPINIVVDRCLIRGSDNPPIGMRRGVSMQCQYCAVINSYIDQIHEIGFDTQAIGGWNSTGPWLVDNNFLEGAGENILVGGADSNMGTNPADLTFTRNYIFKPYTWKVGDPTYAGTHWSIKNLLELKTGVRVLIEGNVFSNVWVDAQTGEAIKLNSGESGSGLNTWTTVSDVTFRYNEVENAEGGFGGPFGFASSTVVTTGTPTHRVSIHDNLMTNLGGASGRNFLGGGDNTNNGVYGAASDVLVDHNTFVIGATEASSSFSFESFVGTGQVPMPNFAIHDNIFERGVNGLGANCSVNGVSQSCYTSDSWWKNLVYDTSPSSTWCSLTNAHTIWAINAVACPVNTVNDVGFVNIAGGDYHLLSTSPGHDAALDGTDVGANIDLVNSKTAGVVQ